MNKLHVVTVGTSKDGYYNILVDSGSRVGVKIINIGLGKEWTGLTMKYTLLKKYLNNLRDDDIVLFLDAYDVFLVENEQTILNKFYKFNKPIVFGNQNGLLTNLSMITCNKNNLNTGSYIGYVKYLKILLNILDKPKIYKKFGNDDQLVLNHICKNNKFFDKYTGVDIKQDIFYITNIDTVISLDYWMNGSIGLRTESGRLLKRDSRQPSIVHLAANVCGKKYVKYLNYDVNKIASIDVHFKVSQVKVYISLFFRKYWVHLLTIVILIILLKRNIGAISRSLRYT